LYTLYSTILLHFTSNQVDLNDEESVAAASEQIMEQIRVARQTNEINNLVTSETDQDTQESKNAVQADENGALDELTLDGADDDENRNKR
jgi:urease gamma subunit